MKIARGTMLAAGGPALLVLASGIIEHSHEKVSFIWAVAYSFVNDLGFANVMPVGLALYSRAAPQRTQGFVIGLYYLQLFFCNVFVGWLAGFLEAMPGARFWGMHAVLVAGAGALLLVIRSVFGRLLAPEA